MIYFFGFIYLLYRNKDTTTAGIRGVDITQKLARQREDAVEQEKRRTKHRLFSKQPF